MTESTELGPLERRLIDADLGPLSEELPDPAEVATTVMRDPSTGLLAL